MGAKTTQLQTNTTLKNAPIAPSNPTLQNVRVQVIELAPAPSSNEESRKRVAGISNANKKALSTIAKAAENTVNAESGKTSQTSQQLVTSDCDEGTPNGSNTSSLPASKNESNVVIPPFVQGTATLIVPLEQIGGKYVPNPLNSYILKPSQTTPFAIDRVNVKNQLLSTYNTVAPSMTLNDQANLNLPTSSKPTFESTRGKIDLGVTSINFFNQLKFVSASKPGGQGYVSLNSLTDPTNAHVIAGYHIQKGKTEINLSVADKFTQFKNPEFAFQVNGGKVGSLVMVQGQSVMTGITLAKNNTQTLIAYQGGVQNSPTLNSKYGYIVMAMNFSKPSTKPVVGAAPVQNLQLMFKVGPEVYSALFSGTYNNQKNLAFTFKTEGQVKRDVASGNVTVNATATGEVAKRFEDGSNLSGQVSADYSTQNGMTAYTQVNYQSPQGTSVYLAVPINITSTGEATQNNGYVSLGTVVNLNQFQKKR